VWLKVAKKETSEPDIPSMAILASLLMNDDGAKRVFVQAIGLIKGARFEFQ
jgi:hypothetical protein